jgi:hypothetical protein
VKLKIVTPKKMEGMGSGMKAPLPTFPMESKKEKMEMIIRIILLFIFLLLGPSKSPEKLKRPFKIFLH